MNRTSLLTVGLAVIAAMVLAVPGMCQPGAPEWAPAGGQGMGGQGGQHFGHGGPGMGGPGGQRLGPGGQRLGPGGPMAGGQHQAPPPGGPTVTVTVVNNVVYVACDGKLIAYEAKTLTKLAEATYREAPERGRGQGQEQGRRPRAGRRDAGAPTN